jgi:hypothetical protein
MLSVYVCSANNPIRFIDVNGDGIGDPVVYSSLTAKKGNVLIYVVDPAQGFVEPSAEVLANWDIIVVTALVHVQAELERVYSDKMKVKTMVIDTHGANGGSIVDKNSTGITRENINQVEPTVELIKTDNFPDVITQKGEPLSFLKYMDENSKLLLVACNSAMKNGELLVSTQKAVTEASNVNNVAVYGNEGITETNDRIEGTHVVFLFDVSIDSKSNTDARHWMKAHDNEKGETVVISLGKKEPEVTSKGEIEWDVPKK